MAAGMNAGDGGNHLITYHPTGIQSSSRWFQNDAWLSFNMVQSRHIVMNRSYEMIAQDWQRTPPKPVVDGESAYEGIVDDLITYKPGVPLIQAQDVRRIAYCTVFAGAAGLAYGSQGSLELHQPDPGRAAIQRPHRVWAGTGVSPGSPGQASWFPDAISARPH